MVQRNGKGVNDRSYMRDPNKSLMEKWNEHMDRWKKANKHKKNGTETFMRCLMLFQTPTQLYVLTVYAMPYACTDYNPWTLYCIRFFCWFLAINGFANWFGVILYDPSYQKSKDNPYFNVNHKADNPPDKFQALIQESNHSHQNGGVVLDMKTEKALPWNFCQYCNMHVPPRANHCKFCDKCILKRDHHCFMVGNCVGFNNQRYFIMFNFYVMVYEAFGFYFTIKYLREVYWPMSDGLKEFFFPIAVWRWLFGSMEAHYCLMMVHIAVEFLFSMVGGVYFASQIKLTKEGRTLLEVAKNIPIRNTNGYKRNFRSVFGDFWYLNFFFPLTPIFRQMDDGIHWDGVKFENIDKWKDDGELL